MAQRAQEGPADAAAWVTRYRGLRLQQALRLARLEQRAVRVIGPGQVVTADWLPQRLTLVVDSAGDVVTLRAG